MEVSIVLHATEVLMQCIHQVLLLTTTSQNNTRDLLLLSNPLAAAGFVIATQGGKATSVNLMKNMEAPNPERKSDVMPVIP